jgi:hypothetical protein
MFNSTPPWLLPHTVIDNHTCTILGFVIAASHNFPRKKLSVITENYTGINTQDNIILTHQLTK